MPPTIEAEKDPFVDAFAQYLDALQEATCNRLLGMEKASKVKAAGKTLVETAEPSIRESTKLVVHQIETVEESGELVSKDVRWLLDASNALRRLIPYMDERGFIFHAGVWQINADRFLQVYLGRGVRVEEGCLHSTVLLEHVVEVTDNRFFREKRDPSRLRAWTDYNETYYDFEILVEKGTRDWKKLKGLIDSGESDPRQTRLRKLAYGKLFEKHKNDEVAFGIESGLMDLTSIIPHEFYHERVVGNQGIERAVEEAGAHLYALTKVPAPENLFKELYRHHRMKDDLDESYKKASTVIFVGLGRAYANCSDIDADNTEELNGFRGATREQAKNLLGRMEKLYCLPSHEDAERELKPDFEKYGKLVRAAVMAHYAGRKGEER